MNRPHSWLRDEAGFPSSTAESEHVNFTALQYYVQIILTLQAEGQKGHELGTAKSDIGDARSEEGGKQI